MTTPAFALVLIVYFLFCGKTSATGFSISAIPDLFLKNANSVVRYSKTEVEVNLQYEMTVRNEWAVTVLNSSGNAHLNTVVNYNRSVRIVSMAARVYDAEGNELKRLRSSDIIDWSAVGDALLFTDARQQFINYIPTRYPYTFWFRVEYRTTNTAFLPAWIPGNYTYQYVMASSYQLLYPEGWRLSTSENNFESHQVHKSHASGKYHLTVSGIPPTVVEHLAPSHEHFLLSAFPALNHFSLEGIRGTANNWQEFGE